MPQSLREFVSGDAFVALLALAAVICTFAALRLWRSPHSWHIDEETKQLRFHAWREIAMAGAGASVLAILTILTF